MFVMFEPQLGAIVHVVVLLPAITTWRFLDRGRMTRFPRTDVIFPGSLVAKGVDKPSFSAGGRGSESRDGGSSLERAFRKARGLRCRR